MGKHFDAPTGRGYHPHAVRPGEERRGEHSGYQTRSSVSGTDVQDSLIRGQSSGAPGAPFGTVQQQSMLDWAAQHPLLVAGILLGGAVLIANSAGARENPRRNPDGDAPRWAMPLSQPLTIYPDCATPAAVARTPRGGDPNVLEDYLPAGRAPQTQSAQKTKRTRRTSQARDAKGHYLTAGTRKKTVTEGK